MPDSDRDNNTVDTVSKDQNPKKIKSFVLIVVEAVCIITLIIYSFTGAVTFYTTRLPVLVLVLILFTGASIFVILQSAFVSLFSKLFSKFFNNLSPIRVQRNAISLFKLIYNILIVLCWRNGGILEKEYIDDIIPVVPFSSPLPTKEYVSEKLWSNNVTVINGTNGTSTEIEETTSNKLNNFFLLIMTYFTSELLILLPETDRVDYLEMLSHHTVGVGLTICSYLAGGNILRLGSLIAYCHCCSDVFIYLSRVTIDTKSRPLILFNFFLLTTSFFWYRLVVFPFILLRSVYFDTYPYLLEKFEKFDNSIELANYAWSYYNISLGVLYALNGYWGLLIIRVGYNFIKTNKTIVADIVCQNKYNNKKESTLLYSNKESKLSRRGEGGEELSCSIEQQQQEQQEQLDKSPVENNTCSNLSKSTLSSTPPTPNRLKRKLISAETGG